MTSVAQTGLNGRTQGLYAACCMGGGSTIK
jgi:hypothetical protein